MHSAIKKKECSRYTNFQKIEEEVHWSTHFMRLMKLISDIAKDTAGNETFITLFTLTIAKHFLKVKILENQLCNM